MSSFTMEMLLKRHGLEDRLHDSTFTNLVGHKLRMLGWRQRKFKRGNKWWTVWSDSTEWTMEETKFSQTAEDNERLAAMITKDPPLGVIETKNGWID